MTSRECALKVLYDVEFNGAYSNLALKTALPQLSDERDRSLAAGLVYGVIDKKITLDYIITQFSKLKLKKISKYILLILRMGIYQLKFMEKIPESAAVNECVKLARRYGHSASAGFVNGILRNAAKNEIKYPSDKMEYLSVRYSFPKEHCEKWTKDFGYDFTEALLKECGTAPKLTLRPNALKTTADMLCESLNKNGVKAVVSGGYIASDGFDIANDRLYKEGFYTVQDAAAMRVSEVLAPSEGDTVIDMCAAPGGKTTHMAELMQNKGKIFAFDIYEHKTELIKKNAARLGIDIIEAHTRDGREPYEQLFGSADKVLCDAPCSGYGIIRRKPEIKYAARDGLLPDIQRKLLDNAAKYVKSGGDLVYSTCTIEKEENENITSSFLSEHPTFKKVYEKTFYPHIDGTDGFYICKMTKTDQRID